VQWILNVKFENNINYNTIYNKIIICRAIILYKKIKLKKKK